MRTLATLLLCIISGTAFSQEPKGLQPMKGRFAVDTTSNIAVWSPKLKARNFLWKKTVDSIHTNGSSYAVTPDFKWLYNNEDSIQLVKTKLPLIHIQTNQPIVDEPKTLVRILYTHNDTLLDLTAGIEHRGNSALRYPKKSYDVEFRDPEQPEESVDVQLENMRNDDDWILNSIYNEPLRLRSRFSNELWLEIQRNPKKTKGSAGVRMRYAEVFLDNKYLGTYLISEQVDRKLLKLKKKDGDTVRGELFKASGYQAGTQFSGAPPFNNAFPSWAGFEMEYPYEDYTAHYNDLFEFVTLVSTGSDEAFNKSISDWLNIDNAIDYYLFVNLLRATDNLGKNYFLAREDVGEPYYFVPWDLDGVLGTIQDGKRIPTTDDVLSNGLFDRLWINNPSEYRSKVKARWNELRSGPLSNNALFSRLERLYVALNDAGVYVREKQLWNTPEYPVEDYDYLINWLEDRLEFLDGYFSAN